MEFGSKIWYFDICFYKTKDTYKNKNKIENLFIYFGKIKKKRYGNYKHIHQSMTYILIRYILHINSFKIKRFI